MTLEPGRSPGASDPDVPCGRATRAPWFQTAVIYELDVRAFFDADGDGWGDFAGLVEKLPYLGELGVDTLWLNPIFVSPGRDGGYDISDYYRLDPALGTREDFGAFLRTAKESGMRVIVELVANHTSDQHPWFQAAVGDRESTTRRYYFWADRPPEDAPPRIVFTEDEADDPRSWTFHDRAGQYYLHRFYRHEPDLDHANPAVREEMFDVVSHWLEMGVDGFRIDAAPYIGAKAGADPDLADDHSYLKALRAHVEDRNPEAILMAEADVDASQLDEYFGAGDEMHLTLSFLASQTIFLALARKSSLPLRAMLRDLPPSPAGAAYANFLRNHDELDLERLTPPDRQFVFDTFAPRPDMRIFGRGIRRRPAPMLDGDPDRLRLAHSLTFALPGVAILRYGDEIGMGDDLSLPDRAAVRTPMQWNGDPNAGFSRAPASCLQYPVIAEGPFGFGLVNVAAQEHDRCSLLSWMKRLIAARRQAGPIGTGRWRLIEAAEESVLAISCADGGREVTTLHNLSPFPRTVSATQVGAVRSGRLLFADAPYRLGPTTDQLTLGPFGYAWVSSGGDRVDQVTAQPPPVR